jgi:signal recognition particle subunit SRP54
MFERLTESLQLTFRRFKGKVTINEQDIRSMVLDLRAALLDADVHVSVIDEILADLQTRALDEQVIKGVKPAEKIISIFESRLKEVLGEGEELPLLANPTIIMMVGLQGTGKTTQAAKLAKRFHDKKVLLVAADTQRPAAITQLQQLGSSIGVDVYTQTTTPLAIASNAVQYGSQNGFEVIIIDTAGRLSIDESLMSELADIKKATKPNEILFVMDAMTGQSSLEVAQGFNQTLSLTGAIITKLDGDARGGAAISFRYVVGVPIRYVGTGEKIEDLDLFHGDRLANRILGMGDIASFVEKAEAEIDPDESMKLMEKMMTGKMNYNDMLSQFKMMRRMGSLSSIAGMIPGLSQMKQLKDVDDSEFTKIEVLIQSMTPHERRDPKLISDNHRRRRRIADGAGRKVADVNRLIQSLEQQQKMAKMMAGMPSGRIPQMPQIQPKKSRGKGKGRRPW